MQGIFERFKISRPINIKARRPLTIALYIIELEVVNLVPHEKLTELIGGLDRRGQEYYLRNVTKSNMILARYYESGNN